MGPRLISTLVAVALCAACGSTGAGSPATTAAGATTAPEGTTVPGEATTITPPLSRPLSCDALVTLDEVAALFGEPATFDPEASESPPGSDRVDCVWFSVEDPADLEDLQVQLLQIRAYPKEQHPAPGLLAGPVEPIEGIGDEAFVGPHLGVSAWFVAGDRVVLVTFSVIGAGDAPEALTREDRVVDLLRQIYRRVA